MTSGTGASYRPMSNPTRRSDLVTYRPETSRRICTNLLVNRGLALADQTGGGMQHQIAGSGPKS